MGITYNAGTNIVTVTGYTEAIPCTFHDIKLAEMAGAWDCIDEAHGYQFNVRCNIQIGDGVITTWFGDVNKQIIFAATPFTSPIKSFPVSVLVKNHATFRLGKLHSATKKTSEQGCTVLFPQSTRASILGDGVVGAKIELFSSSFAAPNHFSYIAMSEGLKIYNSLLTTGMEFYELFDVDMYNVIMSNRNYRFGIANCIGIMDRISLNNYWYPLDVTTYDYGESVTFRNLVINDTVYYMIYLSSLNFDDALLINCISDEWTFKWEPAWPSTKHVIRQYEFELKVIEPDRTPIPTASVKIWDLGNNLVVNTTTDGNGNIAMQTLNYGYYCHANGSAPTMETPHKIKITKPGFKTGVKYMFMDYKRKETVAMRRAHPVNFCDNELILQLAPESIEDDQIIYTKI